MVSPDGDLIAGRYRLSRKLGEGGMGVVWHGHDTLLGRAVAVKEVRIPPGLPTADHERQLMRTAREARTAARLNHPSIVQIYDVVERDGRPWIVMELITAQPLDEIVRTTGPVPVRHLAALGRQVLSALQAAHEAGILHRDVKPSNILVTAEGRAVLTDFGIATAEGDASLTQTGMVAGSPSFLAPERARGQVGGPPSDMWSLGATLYAGLMGRSPFERADTMTTITALLTEEPELGRIPRIFHDVLRGLLERDPAQRLTAEQTDEMLQEIEGVNQARRKKRGKPAEPPPPGPAIPILPPPVDEAPPRRRKGKRAVLLAGALVVLLGGSGTAWWALDNGTRSRPADAATSGPVLTGATVAASPKPTPLAAPPSKTPLAATPVATPSRTRTAGATRIWRSKKGWTIAYPRGWKGSRADAYTEWLRRDGNAHLGVEDASGRGTDPLELLQGAETVFSQYADALTTVRQAKVRVPGGHAAEWEFTWVGGDFSRDTWVVRGQTYREVRRAVVAGGQAYILEWVTTDDQWQAQRRLRTQIFRSFTPGGAR